MYFYLNGIQVKESRWLMATHDNSPAPTADQGSMTVVSNQCYVSTPDLPQIVHMMRGDTLELRMTRCDDTFRDLVITVALTGWDYP